MIRLHIQEAFLENAAPSYVRVKLVGDSERFNLSTKVRSDTFRPFYDEYISWEIQDGDYRKQLCLTVYQQRRRDVEAIGIINIDISSVLVDHREVFNCWTLKPVPSTSTELRCRRRKKKALKEVCSRLDKSDLPLKKLIIVRPTETSCYGLSLFGRGYVSSIEPKSSASRAGLEVGDQLHYINGTCVRNSSSHEIVTLLKNQGVLVELSVYRTTIAHQQLHHRSLPLSSKEHTSRFSFLSEAISSKHSQSLLSDFTSRFE